MRIVTAICRRYERRPTDVSVVKRKMMWKGYKNRIFSKILPEITEFSGNTPDGGGHVAKVPAEPPRREGHPGDLPVIPDVC